MQKQVPLPHSKPRRSHAKGKRIEVWVTRKLEEETCSERWHARGRVHAWASAVYGKVACLWTSAAKRAKLQTDAKFKNVHATVHIMLLFKPSVPLTPQIRKCPQQGARIVPCTFKP